MTNKKSAKKAKTKDDSNPSASRRSGYSLPRTDTEHKLSVGVDQIPNLDDCPIEFENDKEFLPHWALLDVPSEMQRMHTCTRGHADLGSKPYMLRTIRMYSDLKGMTSMISCPILETSRTCSATKN